MKPATFWLVAQCLNQLRHRVPPLFASTRCFCQILMKPEFSPQIFEESSDIKFHENPSSGSHVVPRGLTGGEL
jgi:hypothetical protein